MISQKLFSLARHVEAKHAEDGFQWENIVRRLDDLAERVQAFEAGAVDPSERIVIPPADVVEIANFLYANKTRRGMVAPDDGGDAA